MAGPADLNACHTQVRRDRWPTAVELAVAIDPFRAQSPHHATTQAERDRLLAVVGRLPVDQGDDLVLNVYLDVPTSVWTCRAAARRVKPGGSLFQDPDESRRTPRVTDAAGIRSGTGASS